MHTNYYEIVKLLKSFKIIIVAPTCFGLHKPSSGSSQPVLRQSYNVYIGYISLFVVIDIVAAATIPKSLINARTIYNLIPRYACISIIHRSPFEIISVY